MKKMASLIAILICVLSNNKIYGTESTSFITKTISVINNTRFEIQISIREIFLQNVLSFRQIKSKEKIKFTPSLSQIEGIGIIICNEDKLIANLGFGTLNKDDEIAKEEFEFLQEIRITSSDDISITVDENKSEGSLFINISNNKKKVTLF